MGPCDCDPAVSTTIRAVLPAGRAVRARRPPPLWSVTHETAIDTATDLRYDDDDDDLGFGICREKTI